MINAQKLQRAKAVLAKPDGFTAESVEAVLLAKAKGTEAEKLEFIYKGLGGAFVTKEVAERVVAARKRKKTA